MYTASLYIDFYYTRSYMDECQDQMTELRKQKIDLSRERKRMQVSIMLELIFEKY